ncbi:MAG TPA: di-heme oxidoredictase family protein [Thermoanaerobaculia bacterium]|nr:di-heme oxidoredictase family protein [Thermoanaerobaculia bacterium]
MKKLKVLASVAVLAVAVLFVANAVVTAQSAGTTEAPAGFDGEDNGFAAEFCANQDALVDSPNSPQIPAAECDFEAAEEEFTGPETVADGLGPIYNAEGCGTCHSANPQFDPDNFERKLVGATSAIVEKRAGFFNGATFFDHPGGSLIQDRSLRPNEQERVLPGHNVIALRSTLSVLGDGFVEAVGNSTLQAIAANQPSAQRGQLIAIPVLEKPGTTRFGRFGHKDQHASLVSFSADAYLNEMGITSPLQPNENTSNGTVVDDPVPGLDDEGVDVELFALFMRATKVPPVDADIAATSDAQLGKQLFSSIGCAVCHTPTIVTEPPGTFINGGALRVANALGNKIIHPFSDFLLHDVGTGDGIVQNGGQSTRNKIRTAALWGLRARGRFMHDALSFSVEDAIQRHGNQAASARANFNALSTTSKNRVLKFLSSL